MSLTSTVDSLLSKVASNEPITVKARVNADGTGIAGGSSTTTGGDGSSVKKADKEMGKDDFLLLLVTQMRYQDPLNPMENTEFVSQLAQFRALEGTSNIEEAIKGLDGSFKDSLDAQKTSANSMASTAAVSLIGKTARMQVENIKWYASVGEKVEIPVYLGGNKEATVEICNSEGTVVKTFKAAGKDSENTVRLSWDGATDKGTVASAGEYKVRIVGEDKDDSLYAFVEDVVTGVRFTDDNALVKIHGLEIPLGNVLDVAMGNGSGSNQFLSQGSAVSLLGKTVRVKQDVVTYRQRDDEVVGVKVNAQAGSRVQMAIVDAAGKTVQTLSATAEENGVAFFSWNGSVAGGGYASAGTYALSIAGADRDPSLYAFVDGKVEGVSNLPGSAQVRIAGVNFDLGAIVDIAS